MHPAEDAHWLSAPAKSVSDGVFAEPSDAAIWTSRPYGKISLVPLPTSDFYFERYA